MKQNTREEMVKLLSYEKELYHMNMKRILWGKITHHCEYRIWKWLKYSRKCDYYSQFYYDGFWAKIRALYYIRKRNFLAEKLGFDIDTQHIGKGLLVYHTGTVIINGNALVGDNCVLHGNNCIGNKGPIGSPCPEIGNNVEIGVGAIIIGGVKLADGIKVGAGAVVVSSFTERGITIAGVPAKKIKESSEQTLL